jgi:hypothetical protein
MFPDAATRFAAYPADLKFADPEGVVTYFRMPEYSNAGVVEDELTMTIKHKHK